MLRSIGKLFGFTFTMAVICLAVPAWADIAPGDQIVAEFSDVVLSGNVANDPATGDLTYMDNTGTAVYSIGNDVGTNNDLQWGSPGFSELTFFGTGVSVPTDQTTPFLLGSLFFFNGESALNTLIFGATLTFYDQSGTDPSDLTPIGSDNVVITTTSNQYTAVADPTTDQLQYGRGLRERLRPPQAGMCGESLEAYEAAEDPGALTDS
jgi:hypothetical protein